VKALQAIYQSLELEHQELIDNLHIETLHTVHLLEMPATAACHASKPFRSLLLISLDETLAMLGREKCEDVTVALHTCLQHPAILQRQSLSMPGLQPLFLCANQSPFMLDWMLHMCKQSKTCLGHW